MNNESIGGKVFRRHLDKCTGCRACNEAGFRKVRVI